MKKFLIIFVIFFINLNPKSFGNENLNGIVEGNEDAKIEILVYESLTCPHCATFHKEIYPDLKKDFIDKGLAKIEFKNFPLDLAGLNASKIAHCKNDGKSDILHFLYYNQDIWTKGETIEQINLNLKAVINKGNFEIDFNKCINNKKFDKPLTYKNLKKAIEKLI